MIFSCFNKENIKIHLNTLFLSAFYIRCLIRALVQIHEISAIYFSYETTTRVEYDIMKLRFFLPAITLCGFKQQFMREEYQKQVYGN